MKRDLPDDPLLKPASDDGWEMPKPASEKPVEPDPAAPRRAPKPDTAEPKPVASEPTPVATAPKPDIAEPKPEIIEPKPEIIEPKPEIIEPKPADPNTELRAAIGALPVRHHRRRPGTDDDNDDPVDAEGEPRSLKSIFALIAGIAGIVLIGTFVVLGRLNSDKFALICEAERAVPQQGRAFPPWGYHALGGDAWRPLKIAAETRCQSRETDDALVLERWFLAMLLEEATAHLTARDITKLDDTDALLKQGLLLTRPPAVPEAETFAAERTARHNDIERMQGDVIYWRAAAKLRDAATAVADAAKQFDAAAALRPRHVSDATAWGTYARKLADQLRIGPSGGAPPSATVPIAAPVPAAEISAAAIDAPTPPRPLAPQGTALPVEPDKAEPATKPTAEPDKPPPAPIAPTGGVLL